MKKILVVLLMIMTVSCASATVETKWNNCLDKGQVNTIRKAAMKLEGNETILSIDESSDRAPVFEEDIGLCVIAKINSIDGYDNYWSDANVYGGIYTYGQLEIVRVFIGDIEEGECVGFAIAGGTLPFDRYAKGQDPVSLEKQIRTIKENGYDLPAYVTRRIEGTQIEEGNVYYLVTGKRREARGGIYQILPYPDTFMLIDESTLEDDAILGYRTDAKVWQDVTKIRFPKDADEFIQMKQNLGASK
ncbi:MAG: hypothetical protein IKF46_07320 [Erysipelotrichaceae bacterium]|nr:hypothetical protein [Erysipelotrichaceae bacterium]